MKTAFITSPFLFLRLGVAVVAYKHDDHGFTVTDKAAAGGPILYDPWLVKPAAAVLAGGDVIVA